MSCTFEKLYHEEHGLTFYRGEPGNNPVVTLTNVPVDWTRDGYLTVSLCIVFENDTTDKAFKLAHSPDRRFNLDNNIQPENAYVVVRRRVSADGTYEIPVKKGLPLSRDFKGGQKELPRMFIRIMSQCTKKFLYSDYFVTMSKRQPEILGKQKRGVAEDGSELDHEIKKGTKRQKTTELNKELASNNRTLTASWLKTKGDLQRIQSEHDKMKELIKQLACMSEAAQSSGAAADIMKCFRITISATDSWHFMKEQQSTQVTALGHRRV
jgi:hypothetical protein